MLLTITVFLNSFAIFSRDNDDITKKKSSVLKRSKILILPSV